MGSSQSKIATGRIINDTPFSLTYTIKSFDVTLKNIITRTQTDGDLVIPTRLQLKGKHSIEASLEQLINEGKVCIPPYQKTSQSLTLFEKQMHYLSIEVNGKFIMENAPIYKLQDCHIYIYSLDGQIRWKQVLVDFKWDSHEDNIYLKTKQKLRDEVVEELEEYFKFRRMIEEEKMKYRKEKREGLF